MPLAALILFSAWSIRAWGPLKPSAAAQGPMRRKNLGQAGAIHPQGVRVAGPSWGLTTLHVDHYGSLLLNESSCHRWGSPLQSILHTSCHRDLMNT